MELHPLIDPDTLAARLKNGMSLDDALIRGTGRSTLAALKVICTAVANPNKWVVMQFHANEPRNYSTVEHQRKIVADISARLGLKHMQSKADSTPQLLVKFSTTFKDS